MENTTYRMCLISTLIIAMSCVLLLLQWMNHMTATGADGRVRRFEHPYFQCCLMFAGCSLCLPAYAIAYRTIRNRGGESAPDANRLVAGNRDVRPWWFMLPAILRMITTTIYLSTLFMTFSSNFRILEGTSVLFAPVLSTLFLSDISAQKWCGIYIMAVGLLILGAWEFLHDEDAAHGDYDYAVIITGDVMLMFAELLRAVMLVYEEWVLVHFDVCPLEAAGWEGACGFTLSACLLLPFYFIHTPKETCVNSACSVEDTADAVIKMLDNTSILLMCLGLVVACCLFYYASLAMVKELSAVTRNVLGSLPIVFVWCASTTIGWLRTDNTQMIGGAIVVIGTLVYCDTFLARLTAFIKSERRSLSSDVPNHE